MKKTVFMAVLLAIAFAALIGSCASTGGNTGKNAGVSMRQITQAAGALEQGDFYAWQFEIYKALRLGEPEPETPKRAIVLASKEGMPTTNPRCYGDKTDVSLVFNQDFRRRVRGYYSSEADIDKAIEAYEASLAIIPAGVWEIPEEEFKEWFIRYYSSIQRGYTNEEERRGTEVVIRASLLPPEGGVQARLAEAQKRKQEWLAKKQELRLED